MCDVGEEEETFGEGERGGGGGGEGGDEIIETLMQIYVHVG